MKKSTSERLSRGDTPLVPPGPRQRLLFSELGEDELRLELERAVSGRVRLVLTRNRRSVLRVYKERARSASGWRSTEAAPGATEAGDTTVVRLQRAFLEAPPDVRKDLLAFVRKPSDRTRRAIVGWFERLPESTVAPDGAGTRRERAPRPISVRTAGRVYELSAIFDVLNACYFENRVRSRITWGESGGRRAAARGRRHIRFGAYYRERDLIRIHPVLDQAWVPRFFVESIVYHEMLHAEIPIEEPCGEGGAGMGRRRIHPPEFKRRERLFEAFAEAAAWEKKHLKRLLRAAAALSSEPSA